VTRLKKALIYLGLGPDEDYDYEIENANSYDEGVGDLGYATEYEPQAQPQPQPQPLRPVATPVVHKPSAVRVLAADPVAAEAAPVVRTAPEVQPAVKIVDSPSSSPHVVTPVSFNDAQTIGDRFRSGQAVVVNVEAADRELRRRLIDFASGLCYGLGGRMDRAADQVYLLIPANVDMSDVDVRRVLR
jgi:cell division inhibitor SepF